MAKYDFKYGKGTTELFGKELLDFLSGEVRAEEMSIPMEYKLTLRLATLNARYHSNSFDIESSIELCKQYWNFYKVGITFLADFLGYAEVKNETCEELSYYLMDYLIDGHCNAEFVKDTFACMVLVKGDLDRLSRA